MKKIHDNRKGVRRKRSSVVLSSTFVRGMSEIPRRGLYCDCVRGTVGIDGVRSNVREE